MTTVIGRNVRIEIATAFGAPITVNSITKANPAVCTASAAHTLTVGAVGFFSVTDGMVELHNQAGRVSNSATPAFTIQSLDTSGYSAAVTGGATYTPASTWALLSESAGYEIPNGDPDRLDDTRLHDVKHRNIVGMLAAQSITISTKPQTTNSTVMDKVEQAARAGVPILMRITLQDGAVRVYYGTPSLPGESVQAGALASGQFSVIGDGWVLKGAA